MIFTIYKESCSLCMYKPTLMNGRLLFLRRNQLAERLHLQAYSGYTLLYLHKQLVNCPATD